MTSRGGTDGPPGAPTKTPENQAERARGRSSGGADWQLSPQALQRFLDALDTNRDRAAERYEQLRIKLIRFFEWRHCPYPEEQADETLTRVIRKLDTGEVIENAATYCYGVARLVLLETRKQRQQELEALSRYQPAPAPVDEHQIERRVDCLTRCLSTLGRDPQALVIDYHRHEGSDRIDSRKRLAASLGIPLNALRIRIHRLTDRLASCVRRCVAEREHV